MRKLARVSGVAAAAVFAVTGLIGSAPIAAQWKSISVPRKKSPASKPSCTSYPARLDGKFTQVLTHEVEGLRQTHTTTGNLTWVEVVDDLPPLDSRVAPDGQIGSKAWRDFHSKARCPIQLYQISAGEFKVETEHHSSPPGGGSCKGKGTSNYDAVSVLADGSSLYIAGSEYLLTLGAPDYRMGRNTVSGECNFPRVGKFPFSPVPGPTDPNVILILDRRGPLRYGVHGAIDPPIKVLGGQKLSAQWDFAAPAP